MVTEVRPAGQGVAAIVVTYQPELTELQALLTALIAQVQWVILIDNGSSVNLSGYVSEQVILICPGENLGIAAAQNLGMERAQGLGAEFIYLSDQDSLPSPGMIGLLEAAHQKAIRAHMTPVAAVGPRVVDARTGTPQFFIVERYKGPRRHYPKANAVGLIEVQFLIASGSLLSMAAVRAIGGMRSNYFIDDVDTEWCRRAVAAGWRLVGAPDACLHHRRGDVVRRVWFLGWHQFMEHAPLRDYYMFRNTLRMLSDSPLSLLWQLYPVWRLLRYSLYILFMGDRRIVRYRLMARGLRDGLCKRDGRLNLVTGALEPIARTSLDPA